MLSWQIFCTEPTVSQLEDQPGRIVFLIHFNFDGVWKCCEMLWVSYYTYFCIWSRHDHQNKVSQCIIPIEEKQTPGCRKFHQPLGTDTRRLGKGHPRPNCERGADSVIAGHEVIAKLHHQLELLGPYTCWQRIMCWHMLRLLSRSAAFWSKAAIVLLPSGQNATSSLHSALCLLYCRILPYESATSAQSVGFFHVVSSKSVTLCHNQTALVSPRSAAPATVWSIPLRRSHHLYRSL